MGKCFWKNPLNRLIPLFPTRTWLTLFCVHPGCSGADPESFAFLRATGPSTLSMYLWKYSLGSAEQTEITRAALSLCYCLLTLSPTCRCCQRKVWRSLPDTNTFIFVKKSCWRYVHILFICFPTKYSYPSHSHMLLLNEPNLSSDATVMGTNNDTAWNATKYFGSK